MSPRHRCASCARRSASHLPGIQGLEPRGGALRATALRTLSMPAPAATIWSMYVLTCAPILPVHVAALSADLEEAPNQRESAQRVALTGRASRRRNPLCRWRGGSGSIRKPKSPFPPRFHLVSTLSPLPPLPRAPARLALVISPAVNQLVVTGKRAW